MRILKKIWYTIQSKHICSDCNAEGWQHFTMPDFGDPGKDQDFHFCGEHAQKSGFCLGCGYFCGGVESFDFSEMPGYCSDCVDEIKGNMGFYDEDYDYEAGMS